MEIFVPLFVVVTLFVMISNGIGALRVYRRGGPKALDELLEKRADELAKQEFDHDLALHGAGYPTMRYGPGAHNYD